MKERPILFSASMVRAILEGRKTQTRRVVNPRLYLVVDGNEDDGRIVQQSAPDFGTLASELVACPFGAPGDRLWVKETWRPRRAGSDVIVDYAAGGAEHIFYRGEVPESWRMPEHAARGNVTPLHMPRWASRLTLEVTGARVERLHALTETDAMREGVDRLAMASSVSRAIVSSHVQAFARLWDELNGDRAPWKSNPWLWVVSFKRIDGGGAAS